MLILVLESSTTSAKAMLYNTQTRQYETSVKAYPQMYKDITTHDAEQVFLTTMQLGKEVIAGQKINMIVLGGTWHSLMLCDKQMKPATPVYLWSHTGAAKLCANLRQDKEYVNQYYQRTGCMVNAIYPMYKLLMLKEQYQLSDYNIMGQGTYFTYRITGKRIITECMASGTGLMNIHKKKWDKTLLAQIGIEEEQLCEFVPYNQTFPLNQEGANLLGISEGVPVLAANSDGGLNQVGSGALQEGIMTFSVGTSGAMRLSAGKAFVPEKPSTWCYHSPKTWLVGVATSGCCNCVDWFRNGIGNGKTYEELEAGTTTILDTPVFLPFLFGERCPGWDDEQKGGFLGLEAHHGLQEMYCAVQEGVLFNLYQCYKVLVDVNGPPKKIKLSGGILQSESWKQMCADIFQVEMEIDDMPHASLLGGAVLAMEILGVIQDASEYQESETQVIRPNAKNKEIYEQKFACYMKYYNETK